jgi:ribosomal protein L9
MGFDVDRKNIEIVGADVIKTTGAYEAVVKCYKDIKATLKFEVVPSEDSDPQETEAAPAAEAPAAE